MRPAHVVALLLAALFALTACATGKDAVAQGAAFQFVAPGGQTRIFYDQATRKPLPPLAGESLTEPGKQITLSDYDGKVVVLNIWGSWCGPCRTEIPALQQVYDETKSPAGPTSAATQMLGIDVRDDIRSSPRDFVHDRGITYPSIYDPPARSLLALAGYPRNAVPSTIILDRQHRVAAVFLVEVGASDLLPAIHRIAAEPIAAL